MPKRGYRFIASTRLATAGHTPRLRTVALAVALVTLAVLSVEAWIDGQRPGTVGVIAVLPFEVLGGSSDDRIFADGLTEEVYAAVAASTRGRLRVLARRSAARLVEEMTLPEIHDRFSVDLVVQGTLRRAAGGYRVTTQLVDAATETTRWSGAHPEALTVNGVDAHSALSAQVLAALAEVTELELETPRAAVPAGNVQTAWRVARHLTEQRSDEEKERALALLETVLSADPTFVPAHESRLRLLVDLNRLQEAERALVRAEALAEDSPRLALERGRLRLRQWRLGEVERDLAAATAGMPESARAHHALGYFLSVVGRHDHALAEMKIAREIDPVSESVAGDAGLFSYWAGKPALAIERCREVEPYALPEFRLMVTRCLLHNSAAEGDWPTALEKARMVMRAAGVASAAVNEITGADGPEQALRSYFRWAAEPEHLRWSQGGVGSYRAALAAAGAGQVETAIEALERAYAEGEPRLIEIGVEPRLDVLREDDRFRVLEERVGLDRRENAG